MQSKLLHKAGGQRIFAVILATGDEVLSSLQEFVEHENIHAATFTANRNQRAKSYSVRCF